MESCEMCGEKTQLYYTNIEGASLLVCARCARFGKVISVFEDKTHAPLHKKTVVKKETQEDFEIVPNFGRIIKTLREKNNLKQEELALKISEKASLIHSIESGHLEPSFDVARKLERFFRVKLIEKVEASGKQTFDLKSETLTIGDLIRIRKSKNQQ